MDDPACAPADIDRSLEALATVNRWFGGYAAIRRPIERALAVRAPGELRLLDVGTGGADIPRRLARRLGAAGWRPRLCLTDNHVTTLRFARGRTDREGAAAPGVSSTFVLLDAARLPFATDAFDIGFAGTMLHHLETDAAAAFLWELDRVSRLGWVVSDLRRGAPVRLAVELLSATIWRRNEPARLDGRVSVRRAFRSGEIRALLGRAGLGGAVVRAGPFRWVATGGALARDDRSGAGA